jgi:hypothetical protein
VPKTFFQVVTDAVADFTAHGFDSEARLDFWMAELRRAAYAASMPERELQAVLQRELRGVYARMVERAGLLKHHPEVSRFTLAHIAPRMRAELDRRILASANLIRLNRTEAINKTLSRFSGWATSIPKGGSKGVDKPGVKEDIRKSITQLSFEERRVVVDQSHKLVSAISETLAVDSGALAGKWRSHWRQANYNYREDHKERDEHYYVVRGNWAIERGFMKAPDGYVDAIERPAELPFCRCYYVWIYSLRALPGDMLTDKGRQALAEQRSAA